LPEGIAELVGAAVQRIGGTGNFNMP
jgi:hypothetical protein